MNKKRIAIISGIVAAVLLIAAAVLVVLNPFQKTEQVNGNAPLKKEYDSFCTYENDADMKIDGVLDEEKWQNKNWFTHTYPQNESGVMPKIDITGFMTEYGIYIAANIQDTNLTNDGDHTMETNSSLELSIVAPDVGEKFEKSMLYATDLIIDMRGDVHSAQDSNFKRAVVVDGELNSGATKSATIETFFPWDYLQVDTSKGIPKEFGLYPIYRAMFAGEERITGTNDVPTALPSIYAASDYWRYNENGYMTVDREDAVVGDSVIGMAKSGNWDISAEKDGVVRSSYGNTGHLLYFSDVFANNFIMEATIVPMKTQGETSSAAGFYFTTKDGTWHAVHFATSDGHLVDSVNGSKNISKYEVVSYDSKDYVWRRHYDCYKANEKAATREGVKFTLVKNGGTVHYFMDGEYMTSEYRNYINEKVFPAFYAYSLDAIYKDYSCEVVDSEGANAYLNKQGMYAVDVRVKNAGGTAEVSKRAVKNGETYDLTMTADMGYQVSSILVNGKEKIDDAKKNANGGVYTMKAGKANQDIVVTFEKCDSHVLKGVVKGGDQAIQAKVIITGVDNKTLRYVKTANKEAGYKAQVPAGKYNVYVEATDFVAETSAVTVKKETQKDFNLKASMFASSLTVNDKTIASYMHVWDLTKEGEKKVSTSFQKEANFLPVYFAQTGKTALLETTVSYTTDFKDGLLYQSDLLGALQVTDGNTTGWIGPRQHGVVYNHTWIEHVNPYDVLATWSPDHLTYKLGIAYKDGFFHVYIDDIFVTKVEIGKVLPGAGKNTNLAYGLIMHADNPAEIEFSELSFTTSAAKVDEYLKKQNSTQPLAENKIFAKAVSVNGNVIYSALDRWDISRIKEGIVKGSFEMGSSLFPMYFSETGKSALLKTTVKYTTDFKKVGEGNYQNDLFAGLFVSNGGNKDLDLVNNGWTGIRQHGVLYNGTWIEHVTNYDVLAAWAPEHLTVDLAVAYQNGYFYYYVDGIFVAKVEIAKVVPTATKDTELAFGLTMQADKTADIEYSNISFTGNADKVSAFIKEQSSTQPLAENKTFAKAVAVNGNVIYSALDRWDISKIEEGIVKGSFEMGSSLFPMYFSESGKSAVLTTTVKYTTDFAKVGEGNYQNDLFAGLFVSNGGNKDLDLTNNGWVGIRQHGVLYNGNWIEHVNPFDVLAVWAPDHLEVDLGVAYQDGYFYFYVDDVFATKVEVSKVVPNATKDTELAFGLTMQADKTADIEYSNIQFTTDPTKTAEYITMQANTRPLEENEMFAQSVLLDYGKVYSPLRQWDLSKIKDGIVIGRNSLKSGDTVNAPLYFTETGNTALVQMTLKNMTDFEAVGDGKYNQTPYVGLALTAADTGAKGFFGLMQSNIWNGWTALAPGLGFDALTKWNLATPAPNLSVDFTAMIKDGWIYVYANNVYVTKFAVDSVVPGTNADTEFAIGLTMNWAANLEADIEYSNFKLSTDETTVEEFFEAQSSLFTKEVELTNGQKVYSSYENWDLDAINNVLNGSHALQSAWKPMYFKEKGNTALMQATVQCKTDYAAAGEGNYQTDPLVALLVNDGTTQGYVALRQNAVMYTGGVEKWGELRYAVLASWDTAHLTMEYEVALQDGWFYIYLDGVYVMKLAVSDIVPGATKDTELAYGLTMEAYSTCNIEFRNIRFSTDASNVASFLMTDETLFAKETSLPNGMVFTSQLSKWNRDAKNNTLKSTSQSEWQPVYFKETGKQVLFQTTVKATYNDGEEHSPFVMLQISNGTKHGYVGLWRNALVYHNGEAKTELWGELPYAVLATWDTGHQLLTYEVAIQNGQCYIYVDGLLIKKLALTDIVSGVQSGDELSFGISAAEMAGSNVEFSEIALSTDEAKIHAFINRYSDKTTVFIGDSFFDERYFWTDFYTNHYAGKDVFIAGIGGTQTANWTDAFNNALFDTFGETGPKNIVINLGTNDLGAGRTVSDTVEGLKAVFGMIHETYPSTNIYYFGIAARTHSGADALNQSISETNQAVKTWCDANYVTFIEAPISQNDMMADGLHPLLTSYGKYTKALANAGCVIEEYVPAELTTNTLFAEEVELPSGQKAYSSYANWDLSNWENVVKGSTSLSTAWQPLYFRETGNSALLQTTVTRTDNVGVAGATGDPLAALKVSDGVQGGCYLGIIQDAVRWTGDATIWGILPGPALATWSPAENLSVEFSVALYEGYFYVYMDGVYATKLAVSKVVLGATKDSTLAFGLTMNPGSQAEIEFSNIKFTTDVTKVNAFLNENNNLFATPIVVNDKKVWSSPTCYDVSKMNQDILSSNDSSAWQPMYFAETGNVALLQTTVTRTDNIATSMVYGPLAALKVTDGTIGNAYLGVVQNGVRWTNDVTDWCLDRPILTTVSSQADLAIDFAVALKNEVFYVYLDGVFVKSVPVLDVLPGTTATNYGFGLTTDAGAGSRIEFSNIKFTTDVELVEQFMQPTN